MNTITQMSKKTIRKNLKKNLVQISQSDLQKQSDVVFDTFKKLLAQYYHEQQQQKSFQNTKVCLGIACYMNMDNSEIKTMNILKDLFAVNDSCQYTKYKIYLPRCTNTNESGQINFRSAQVDVQDHLTFHQMDTFKDVQDLTPQGKYRLKEPTVPDSCTSSKDNKQNNHPPENIDVIIVPGVGFNVKQMSRIGHGKGYYDDYTERHLYYNSSPTTTTTNEHKNNNNNNNKKRPLLVGVCLKEQIVEQEIPLEEHDYLMDYIIDGSGNIHH